MSFGNYGRGYRRGGSSSSSSSSSRRDRDSSEIDDWFQKRQSTRNEPNESQNIEFKFKILNLVPGEETESKKKKNL